jgi:hypothetical protein
VRFVRPNTKRGQSIVEVALLVPLLALLIVGAYDVSAFVSNKVEVVSAARHGVRIASVLGGIPNNPAPPATHTCDGTLVNTTSIQVIDSQIVQAVVAATSQMSYSTINEIDVYRPASATGVYTVGDHINKYTPNGVLIGTAGFPLTERCQGPLGSSPKDVSVGVRIDWTYVAPNGLGFGKGPVTFAHVIDYSVEKMQQCTDNCL